MTKKLENLNKNVTPFQKVSSYFDASLKKKKPVKSLMRANLR